MAAYRDGSSGSESDDSGEDSDLSDVDYDSDDSLHDRDYVVSGSDTENSSDSEILVSKQKYGLYPFYCKIVYVLFLLV